MIENMKVTPKILFISAVDRAGKDSLINEIDKQTKYKYITVDRGPDAFQAYCEIFDRDEKLKECYKEIENSFLNNKNIMGIYIDCSTKELTRRCIETNHKILDFDYHKEIMEKYFDNSCYYNKIKIDTTKKHVSEIVKELIMKGVL